jgi:hypothetical protein
MYCVLTKNDVGNLPTVISKNDKYFPDYIQSGYEIVAHGSKKEMETIAEEMLTAFAD